jgi:hypothetical protein
LNDNLASSETGKTMDHLYESGKILATTFSGIFSLLFFVETVGTYGVPASLLFTLIGVSIIWGIYSLLGNLYRTPPAARHNN